MKNLRLHDSARTYGSNHLTNNLSVTALKRLLPVFLMMIFLGIGTDVLGQENSTFTGTAIFIQDQLNTFDGAPNKTGEVKELSSDKYITLSSSSENVQATLDDNKGTKVRRTIKGDGGQTTEGGFVNSKGGFFEDDIMSDWDF